MSWPLIAGFLWVVACAVTAMLPMRHQYAPGIILLILAPLIIAWIGYEHGWVVALMGLAAVLSMFRAPLRYFLKKALGVTVRRPEETAKDAPR